MEERTINPYAYWLSCVKGVGNVTIKALMESVSGAEEVYNMSEEEICMCLVDKLRSNNIAVSKACSIEVAKNCDPLEEAEKLKEKGIGFVCQEDSWFPKKLRDISDSPYALYYKGELPPEDIPAVAIIGSRNCSGYGREQARIFAERLAERGIAVISGMARGVDGIAGKAAVVSGGRSYAVLGCGVDVVYPMDNKELYDLLAKRAGCSQRTGPAHIPDHRCFPEGTG